MILVRYTPNSEHLFSLMIDVPTPPDYMSEVQKREFDKHLKQCEDSAIGIDNEDLTLLVNSEAPICMDSSSKWIHALTCAPLLEGETFKLPDSLDYRYDHINPCIPNGDCLFTGDDYRVKCKFTCQKIYTVARLKLKSIPENIDAMEEYSQQQLSEVNKENERLRKALHSIRGALYSRDTLDYVLKDIDEILTENGFEWQPED